MAHTALALLLQETVCAMKPYREVMLLPSRKGCSMKVIRGAIQDQNKRGLPRLMGRGSFETVYCDVHRMCNILGVAVLTANFTRTSQIVLYHSLQCLSEEGFGDRA